MRRHDHSAPFDHALAEASDITHEFWGESRGWQDRPTGRVERPSTLDRSPDDTTGAIRAIRAGVTAFRPQRVDRRVPSGSSRRTRAHGPDTGKRPAVPPTEATLGELADGHPRRNAAAVDPASSHDRFGWDLDTDEPYHEGFRSEIPLSPTRPAAGRLGLGGVDPLLARLGALIVVGVMLVPVALALRPSDSVGQTIRSETPAVDQTVVDTDAPASGDAPLLDGSMSSDPVASVEVSPGVETGSVVEPSTTASSTSEAAPSVTPAGIAAPESSPVEQDDSAGDTPQSKPAEEAVVDALDEAATAEVEAERLLPDCSNTYAATPGDSWYAIAGAADVAPSELLSQNNATTDTVILPGDEICLPPGASISVSTTSDAPAKSAGPATTNAPATTAAATTTNAPATTAAPATAAPTTTTAPAAPASVEQIKQMIRDTWPADQHEMAFFIANRESKFDPRADNDFCCYGVFQIYFVVHERWLDDFGVHTATDLFDANKNIAAAYEIYQRSGGWGPWGY